MRTGRYADAAKSNVAAIGADERYIKATGATGLYPTMYDGHNGRHADVRGFVTLSTVIRVRFHKWDDLPAAPLPDARFPIRTAIAHVARASAYAAKRNVARAEEERAAFLGARRRVAPDAIFTATSTASQALDLAQAILDARLAQARGPNADAIALWTKAVAIEDRIAYDEPPVWKYPTRH